MNTKLIMRRISIDRLKPAKYNPRKDLKPGDPAYEKIKRSLHDFGYVDPVIWNEVTGNIVGGHQRYKVLTAEGATEIDCVVVHIEDPQDEKALNIALNKAVGEWEPKALADLLTDLQLSGYDVGATGFDAAEVDDLFSKVHDKEVRDDDTELDAETIAPFVMPGDLWTLGRHRMLCGDATSEDDLCRLMGDVKANLIVTDPPYNVAYESADGKSIQNDSMEDAAFYEFLLAAFRNWLPHLAEGASAYIFHADTEGLNFRKAFKEAGFSCSLRLGEVLGLTWDCIDITENAIAAGKASIYINKELQRVNRDAMKLPDRKDVILVFPSLCSKTATQQVLKSPKTSSSIRKVFLPKTVAEMLAARREKQMEVIDALGDEYRDFGLVMAGPLGMPIEATRINSAFRKLIEENNLPKVVFHSLRHSSITYKLKLTGGDIKAVQGDSGHSQSKMVTDLYSHILDDDRNQNARLFEEAFYSGQKSCPSEDTPDAPDAAVLMKLLQNPEMAVLIKALAKSL